jgi:type I restriction enzyme, S subunit
MPAGWSSIDVEDVAVDEPAALTDGPFGSNLKTSHYTESGPRVIRLQNIGDGSFVDEKAHISEQHFERLRKHEAIGGDVVVAMLGNRLPRACVVPNLVGSAIVKADCVRLRVDEAISNAAYVTYALNSQHVRSQADELMHGVGRPRLGLKWFRQLKLRLAPIPEQHRIVEAIESYFTRLDDAVATLERVQRNLKRYRASVLKAAIEGRLVPTEAELARAKGRDYEHASTLLQRILIERQQHWQEVRVMNAKGDRDARYENPATPAAGELSDLPEGWVWATTDQLFWFVTSGSRGWAKYYARSGAIFIRIGNLNHESISLDLSKTLYVDPPAGAEGTRTRVLQGDLLSSITADVGMIGLARENIGEAYINQHVSLARPVACIDSSYLAWFLTAPEGGQKQFHALQRGATKAGLGLDDIRSVNVPLPPLREQQRIVQEIERRLSIASDLENSMTVKDVRIQRLRQSILKWAFEGRLVDQDPSDEPASVLLERIKAERAASAANTKRKTTRRKGNPTNA